MPEPTSDPSDPSLDPPNATQRPDTAEHLASRPGDVPEDAPTREHRAAHATHLHDGLPASEPSRTLHPLETQAPRAKRSAELPVIAGYEILDVLGRGGMGVVYKAQQVGLKRLVAIKMILAGGYAGEEQFDRFRAEAEAAARLQHPHIVQVYEVGESGGYPFFSQEYVEGGTLADKLTGAPLAARTAAELIELLAEAIDYAHQKGVVHRDLKPANILLSSQPAPQPQRSEGSGASRGRSSSSSHKHSSGHHGQHPLGVPKIADFGLAKQLDDQSGRTESGSILGTASYMAPEQASGRTHEIGPAADTYALGTMLYELLTGRPPFRGASTLETLEQVRSQEPVPPRQLQPKIPADLETICLKCLRKESGKRYATAGDLASDLRCFLDGRPISARPVGFVERAWSWCRRNPWTAAFLAASLLVFALLAVGGWYRQESLQSQQLARASDELARTQEYYALVNRVREKSASAPLGWTWPALEDLAQAAQSTSGAVSPLELRSVAADALSRFDLGGPEVLDDVLIPSALAFSPDGKRLAIAQNKNNIVLSVHVYDVASRTRAASFTVSTVSTSFERLLQGSTGFQEGFSSLAYSPDGRWLVAGTRFGKICRWDVTQSEPQAVIWQAHGAKEEIRALAFAPDGSSLVSGSDGQGLKRWTIAADWRESIVLPETSTITRVAHSSDGTLLAVAAGRRLSMFLASGEQLAIRPADLGAYTLSFSPKSGTLVCKYGTEVLLLDPRRLEQFRTLKISEEEPLVGSTAGNHVSFSPDGSWLAVSFDDQRVRIWDLASGRIAAILPISGGNSALPLFSPDGRYLALAAEHETYLFEVRPTDVATTLAHEPYAVQACEFTNDGQALVCAVERGTSRFVTDSHVTWWDVETGERRRESRVSGPAGQGMVRFRPLTASLAVQSAGDVIAVTSAAVGTRLVSSKGPADETAVLSCPDARAPVTIEEDVLQTPAATPDVEVRDDPRAANGRAMRLAAGAAGREAVARLPAEMRTAMSGPDGLALYALIRVERRGLAGPAFETAVVNRGKRNIVPWALASIPDEQYHWYLVDTFDSTALAPEIDLHFTVTAPEQPGDVAAVWVDRFVGIPIDTRGGSDDLKVLPQGPLAFSPDGKWLWSVVDGGHVVGWNMPQRDVAARWSVASLNTILGRFFIQEICPGDKWVLAGSNAGDVFVLSAAGSLEKTWRDPGRSIRALALDPAGELAAVGSDNPVVRLVKIPSGESVATLEGHTEGVEALAFSADGKLLVSGSNDRTVRLWRKTETSFELLIALPATGRVRSVRLSPDAKKLAVLCESERAVRLWHLDRLNDRLQAMHLGW